MNFNKIEKTLLLLLLILLLIITFTQSILNYTHETNLIPTLYTVEAILLLQYISHIMLFPTINLLYNRRVFSAVSVQCKVWLFPVVH